MSAAADPITLEVISTSLAGVVQELKSQLRDQRQAGDKAALENTIRSFSVFLDAFSIGSSGNFLVFTALAIALGSFAFVARLAFLHEGRDAFSEIL